MPKEMSKTQIDRLGDRLRKGNVTDDDLKLLEDYRRSFTEAYEVVVAKVREVLRLDPTGRPLKSTTSIIDKLRRETIRLSQMQDIAGCRVTAPDIYSQEAYIIEISNLFEADGVPFTLVDRRVNPSHGYRAVHFIAHFMDRNIEIQVRTELQHVWAEMCEALSDAFGPELKYGGGNPELRDTVEEISFGVAEFERLEAHILGIPGSLKQEVTTTKLEQVDTHRLEVLNSLKETVQRLIDDNDISNSI